MMPQGGVAEWRVDGGEPGIAGGHAVASLGFQMGEERRDERGVDVADVEPGGRFAGAIVGEDQQGRSVSRKAATVCGLASR